MKIAKMIGPVKLRNFTGPNCLAIKRMKVYLFFTAPKKGPNGNAKIIGVVTGYVIVG